MSELRAADFFIAVSMSDLACDQDEGAGSDRYPLEIKESGYVQRLVAL